MSKMGTAYINRLNADADEELALLKRREQAVEFKGKEPSRSSRVEQAPYKGQAPGSSPGGTMEFKTIDPRGGKDRKIVNATVHCVQCGETVEKLIFCSHECEANYSKEVGGWLDGIEELLPSSRAKK